MLRRAMLLNLLTLAVWSNGPSLRAQSSSAVIAPLPYAVPFSERDRNGSRLWGEPDLSPGDAPIGWFAAAQVNVVAPAISQRVTGQVQRGSDVVDVLLPIATLGWTGAPQIEVGYRLPEAAGELGVSYRLLAAAGNSVIAAFDPAGGAALRSRLDAHVIYLDYTSREFSIGPYWDMKAHVGACLPSIFFDSRADGPLRSAHTSSYYSGAGPHLGFDFWRSLPIPGLGFYARTGMVLTVGHIEQQFDDTLATPGGPEHGASSVRKVREVPMANLQVGFSYTPPLAGQQLRLLGGYTIERWWYLAQTDDSRGELTVQGLFLRAEWRY